MHSAHAYSNSATLTFDEPMQDTPFLIASAKRALQSIYRTGHVYKKVGIVMGGIVPKGCYQSDFFHTKMSDKEKRSRAMAACDAINQRFGSGAMQFAAEGIMQHWRMKRGNVSQRFTTCWDELLTINLLNKADEEAVRLL
jgi:DNA polymerase V